jgi:glycosyltransferase involved in cell wall biosynthesis
MEKCLDSIKMQTLKNYEIIIVLDACTDNSEEIARRYTDNIIKVDFHDNGLARNPAIQAAKGDYILFLDSDDWWIHELVLVMLYDKLTQEHKPDILYFSFIKKNECYVSPVGGRYAPAFWNKCWKREFIQQLEVKKGPTGMDRVFQYEALALKPKIVEWDKLMYYYNYMRPGSVTEQKLKEQEFGRK